jgi:hypothetical protein
MTNLEVLGIQAKKIAELEELISNLQAKEKAIYGIIYCIGGPLNDNTLQYSQNQLSTFVAIADHLN